MYVSKEEGSSLTVAIYHKGLINYFFGVRSPSGNKQSFFSYQVLPKWNISLKVLVHTQMTKVTNTNLLFWVNLPEP